MTTGASHTVAPRVLVLLACHNGERWLREQLDSILAQRGVELHLCVGDDASVDGSVAVVRAFQQSDGRISLHAWSEASGSAGANFRRIFREVDATGYEFVALADQDDIWLPAKLAAAIEALQDACGYSCAAQAFWEGGKRRTVVQNDVMRGADFLFEGAGQGCTFVVRQNFFLQVQRFCREYRCQAESLHYHDWLIYLLARVRGCVWVFDSRPWIRYRQHGGNEIGSRGGLAAARERLSKIKNGWYSAQIAAALAVARAAAEPSAIVADFEKVFRSDDSMARRLHLLRFFLLHGRRRMSDRLVMASSALLGWI